MFPTALAILAASQGGAVQALDSPAALIRGEARLQCVATGTGGLMNCTVSSETPAGQGFGQAAVAAAERIALKPSNDGGPVAGSRLSLPVRLEFTPIEAAAAGVMAPGVPGRVLPDEAVWRRRPTGALLEQLYPERAKRDWVSGHARVACYAEANGDMSRCAVLEESPAAYGFGAATVRAALIGFKIKPTDKVGRPTAGKVVAISLTMRLDR